MNSICPAPKIIFRFWDANDIDIKKALNAFGMHRLHENILFTIHILIKSKKIISPQFGVVNSYFSKEHGFATAVGKHRPPDSYLWRHAWLVLWDSTVPLLGLRGMACIVQHHIIGFVLLWSEVQRKRDFSGSHFKRMKIYCQTEFSYTSHYLVIWYCRGAKCLISPEYTLPFLDAGRSIAFATTHKRTTQSQRSNSSNFF
jgi:hypothetical protein